jgi:hypothetical protein
MSSSSVAELQSLLAKLQELELGDPDPELEQQLAAATVAAKHRIATAQEHAHPPQSTSGVGENGYSNPGMWNTGPLRLF